MSDCRPEADRRREIHLLMQWQAGLYTTSAGAIFTVIAVAALGVLLGMPAGVRTGGPVCAILSVLGLALVAVGARRLRKVYKQVRADGRAAGR